MGSMQASMHKKTNIIHIKDKNPKHGREILILILD